MKEGAGHVDLVASCWNFVRWSSGESANNMNEISRSCHSVSHGNAAHPDAVRRRGGQHTGGRADRRAGVEAAPSSAARLSDAIHAKAFV
eukprot:s1667_g1.t1